MRTGTFQEAVQEYVGRQSRRRHPNGRFDNGGRWYASDDEYAECCDPIRNPSRAYPYSWLVHCRTARHVAKLYGVDEKTLKQAAQLIKENGDN